MSKPIEFDTFRFPQLGTMIPRLGVIGTIVLIFSTVVAGCTTPPPIVPPPVYQHWLSDQEDADFRAQCEGKDCVIVPGVLWERIKEALARAMGTAI
jgi:hypothetical protein